MEIDSLDAERAELDLLNERLHNLGILVGSEGEVISHPKFAHNPDPKVTKSEIFFLILTAIMFYVSWMAGGFFLLFFAVSRQISVSVKYISHEIEKTKFELFKSSVQPLAFQYIKLARKLNAFSCPNDLHEERLLGSTKVLLLHILPQKVLDKLDFSKAKFLPCETKLLLAFENSYLLEIDFSYLRQIIESHLKNELSLSVWPDTYSKEKYFEILENYRDSKLQVLFFDDSSFNRDVGKFEKNRYHSVAFRIVLIKGDLISSTMWKLTFPSMITGEVVLKKRSLLPSD